LLFTGPLEVTYQADPYTHCNYKFEDAVEKIVEPGKYPVGYGAVINNLIDAYFLLNKSRVHPVDFGIKQDQQEQRLKKKEKKQAHPYHFHSLYQWNSRR
jgi:hypothetical protein